MGLFTTYKDEINRSSKGLYKGLTTGFCGSLTTFSSWMYVAFKTSFNYYNWYNILIMIVLESFLVWMSLVLGMSAGKTIHEYSDYFFGPPKRPSKEEEPNRFPHVSVDISIPKLPQSSVDNFYEENMIRMKPIIHNPEQVESGDVGSKIESKPEPTKQLLPPKKQNSFCTEWMFWCVFFWISAIPLWITLLYLSDLSFFRTINRRNLFRAVCLAPFGAWLRWALSRITLLSQLNLTLYPQTMLANTIAVLSETHIYVYSNSSWDFAITQGKTH
jgi:fluoride ion exporter CrcB/FEX